MKILSNKKYHELLLKSCKGMFGAVTDDMLLRSNAFLAKEKEQLQDELQRKDNIINELKSSIADYQEVVGDYQDELKRKDNNWNELKTYIKASDDCWDLQAVLDKIKELEENK